MSNITAQEEAHLRKWAERNNPSNMDHEDLADLMLAHLKTMDQEDADYRMGRGWTAFFDYLESICVVPD